MLTEDQCKLAADAYLTRASETDTELWIRPKDELWADAAALLDRGYLDRSWHQGQMVFRVSDAAYSAQSLTGIMANYQSTN